MNKLTRFIKSINKTQKKIIAIVIPILVVLVGLSATDSDYSVHGGEWFFFVLLIGAFEFFWWKDYDKKNE